MPKLFFIVLYFSVIPVFLLAQLPSGFIAEYQLNNSANDVGGNNYNGTLTSAAGTTNRFGTSNAATAFTQGSSMGTLPFSLVTAMENDFSIGFWFKTSMVANSGAQWYSGNSLVDAEECGEVEDWGVALIDGGSVCLGIGNPDITIKSPLATYNDDAWHFVTATRNSSSGTVTLYIEGVEVANSSGTTTAALNVPPNIGLASNPCVPSGVYDGGLDDIIVYDRVLSGAEVSDLYNYMSAVPLPLRWLSFTGQMLGNKAELKWEVEAVVNNEHFEVEHSMDGKNFSLKSKIRNEDGITTAPGKLIFTYSDAGLAKGTHFYRIRQVDSDGRYTFSKTIQLKAGSVNSKFFLQINPVLDELALVNADQIKIHNLKVADASGRILVDRQVKTNDPVIKTSVQKLRPGYYLLKISSATGDVTLPWIKR